MPEVGKFLFRGDGVGLFGGGVSRVVFWGFIFPIYYSLLYFVQRLTRYMTASTVIALIRGPERA